MGHPFGAEPLWPGLRAYYLVGVDNIRRAALLPRDINRLTL
jgi:hypothetical protein